MKLILDNNILFSLMKPFSADSYLFSSLSVEFFAPEFIKSEFNKYKEICLFKSGLSEHEFELRLNDIKDKVKFSKLPEYKSFLKKAKGSVPDPDDEPYIAVALFLNAAIWSNDPHLKQQSLVKVFTTKELVDKLFRGEF